MVNPVFWKIRCLFSMEVCYMLLLQDQISGEIILCQDFSTQANHCPTRESERENKLWRRLRTRGWTTNLDTTLHFDYLISTWEATWSDHLPGGISILHYTDDTLLFGWQDMEEVMILLWILRCFEVWSGLRINFHKSALVLLGQRSHPTSIFTSLFDCVEDYYPLKYLGIPLRA